jgi:glyceraldehyde 3-phosphate dehydrogenase
MKTIGINGFGRIGRTFLRAAIDREDLEILAVNDLTDAPTLAHLLKHDSLWGAFPGEVRAEGSALIVKGRRIEVLAERDPANIPWAKLGVEMVVESTGRFTDKEKAKVHIESGGARKVLISAPAKGEDITIVMGVNHEGYDPSRHNIVSNGSCTTNGLAPLVLALHKAFGVANGLMLTTHAYTNSQALHDQPEKDLRGARSAALSIVPYPSGAAKAIGKVIPELDGKLNGFSLRVPVPVVSVVDLTVNVMRPTTVDEVNAALKEASEGYLRGILGYSEEPLVSRDFQGDDRSGVVDALSTMVMGGSLVKVLAWYDNEWGFSKRLVDLAAYVGSKA